MSTTSQPTPAGAGAPFAPPRPASAPPADDRLLEAARALAPLLREHADAAERERRLARPAVEALTAAGFQRMLAPTALGGHEVDPVTCARVAEELASADSAAAWALQAGNCGAWMASRMAPEGVDEIYGAGPDVIMAASFQALQRAVPVPGGYRFSGRGALASTVHEASWMMMSAMVMDGDRPRMTDAGPEIVAVAMPIRDVEIVDTWQSLGMRGTDSNDVVATDVFVPAGRAFPLRPGAVPGPRFEGPLYRLPVFASVVVIIAPVALAIARGAIDELRQLVPARTSMGSPRPLRDRAAVQAAVAEAEATLRAARLLFYDTLASVWQHVRDGGTLTIEQRADLQLAAAHAAQSGVRVTDLMHRVAGTSGIYARSRLERHFRDAHTVRHHGFLNETRLETAGQVYLGAQLEFPLLLL